MVGTSINESASHGVAFVHDEKLPSKPPKLWLTEGKKSKPRMSVSLSRNGFRLGPNIPEIPVGVCKSRSGAQVYGPEASFCVKSVVPSALLPVYLESLST